MLADVQLLSAFVQHRAFQLLLPDEPSNPTQDGARAEMSPRELDVLRWASNGKTAWETGNILSISEHTVNKHVATAAVKLGCAGKAQAIARTFQQGLLQ
jgi:DNA-binding CsgD family transcriptional regulator